MASKLKDTEQSFPSKAIVLIQDKSIRIKRAARLATLLKIKEKNSNNPTKDVLA